MAVGTRDLSLSTTWDAITAFDPSNSDHLLVRHHRIPRTLLAVLVAGALGMAGLIMQALTRNPLADPGVLGINAGAAVAVAAAITLFGVTTVSGQMWFGLTGAGLAGLLALWAFIARQRRIDHPLLDLRPFASGPFVLGVVMTMLGLVFVFAMNVVIPLFLQARNLHMLNSLLGLIIVYLGFSLAFAIWNLRGFVAAVPRELEEAAYIDGASWFRMFRSVLLPLVAPGLVATSVFSFITAWNEFIFALTFLQSDSKYTVAIGLQRFFGQNTAEWGPIMAASTLITVPVVVFFLLIQRNLVSGLSAGAVKG